MSSKEELIKKSYILLNFCEKNNFTNLIKYYKPIIQYFENDTLNIIVLGEMNRGKSSFINALIGRNLLPVDPKPTTATINILKYSREEKIIVYYSDGKNEILPVNEDSLRQFTANDNFKPETIKYIEIYINLEMLKNNSIIVDTPGVNDISQTRVEITYGFLPLVDLAIFILDSNQPVSASECKFIETQFMKKSSAKAVYAIGKIDRINSNLVESVIESCQDRLSTVISLDPQDEIIPFSTKLYLKDPNDLNNGFNKLKKIIVDFIDTANRNENKIKMLHSIINNFNESIANEINLQEKILNLSVSEKKQVIDNINSEISSKTSSFESFKSYIDLIKSKIVLGIQKSFDTFYTELTQNMEYLVDTYQGNPKDLIEKQLPHQIRLQLKNWVEHHQPHLQKGLNIVAAQIISQFQQNFGKAAFMKNIMVNISGNLDINFDDMIVCDINTMKKNMGMNAFAMGLIGTALIGPLALPIAMMYNNYFGSQKIEQAATEIKMEIKNLLPVNIDKCLSQYKNSALSNIDKVFNEIQAYLNQNLFQQCEELKSKITNVNNQIAETKNAYNQLKEKFDNI